MTDGEIVKALEKCPCRYLEPGCPVERQFDCIRLLHEKVLGLINRQKAEIERLKAERDKEHDYCNHYARMCAKAKAEAIKEFAERLKTNTISIDVTYGYGREHYTEAVAVIEIDNLVEEVAGEDG